MRLPILLLSILGIGCPLPNDARAAEPAAVSAPSKAAQQKSDATPSPAAGKDVAGAAGSTAALDFWLVSSRHLPCCDRTPDFAPEFGIYAYDEQNGWSERSVSALAGADSGVVTVIYVHGNRVETEEVTAHAWQVYQGLRMGTGCQVPMRFIAWSWPSGRVRGQLQDVRIKAQRTLCEGYYLAALLAQLGPEHRVSLVGYSFGGRVVTSALHLLGGGTIRGEVALADTSNAPRQMRATLLAAAVERNTLQPGGAWSEAYAPIEELLVLFNPLDPVLKRFWFVDPQNKPQALGYVGLPNWAEAGFAVEQIDISGYIGRTHRESAYFSSPAVMQMVAPFVLGQATDAAR